jgi:isopentenyl phosphate kinase
LGQEELALVKIGGSVITDKSRPFSLNYDRLDRLASALASYQGRLVIVHGGGSYAHPIAKKYGLTTEPAKIDPKGVTLTRLAVLTLHNEIVLSLLKAGIPAYSIQPLCLLRADAAEVLNQLLLNNLTPVTYGDVISTEGGSYVISGDTLMRIIASSLKPQRVVFTVDVDGLYDTDPKSGRLLKEVSLNWSPERRGGSGFDVTGGIVSKVKEAQMIASMGLEVYFVNGLYPERVLKTLRGEETIATRVSGSVEP